jgi:hypothetical protein
VIPAFLAAIPREKETAKYPRQIGIPSFMPFRKICPFVISFIKQNP